MPKHEVARVGASQQRAGRIYPGARCCNSMFNYQNADLGSRGFRGSLGIAQADANCMDSTDDSRSAECCPMRLEQPRPKQLLKANITVSFTLRMTARTVEVEVTTANLTASRLSNCCVAFAPSLDTNQPQGP